VKGLGVLYRRELDLAWGRGGGPLLACAFYGAIATLLPLALGPEPGLLAAAAPGSAWLALALASLLSLEKLFERDYEDGALELLTLGPLPLEVVSFVKCAAQWTANGLPLAAFSPFAAWALGAPASLAPLVFVSALIGGVGFSFTGGLGAALALGAKRGGVLIAVVVLPLFAPPVIFGAGALLAYAAGLPWTAGFAFLAAYALAAAALSPFAMAAAVRNALS
jgi:heme exporter protein B